MQLVEQQVIARSDQRFAAIDAAAFQAKNLYNAALYLDPGGKTSTSWSGKRVKRGMYQARDGRTLNADVNGSDTILRKAVPDAFGQGVEAPVVEPVWLTLARSVRPKAPAAA